MKRFNIEALRAPCEGCGAAAVEQITVRPQIPEPTPLILWTQTEERGKDLSMVPQRPSGKARIRIRSPD